MKAKNELGTNKKLLFASIFWGLFLCVDILKKSIFQINDVRYVWFYYLFGFAIWFGLTFPLYRVFRWSGRLPPAWRLALLLITGPLTGTIKTVLSWLSFYLSHWYFEDMTASFLQFLFRQRSFDYVEASIIGWVVLSLFFLGELYLKYRDKSLEASELQSQLYQSQLQTLKMQLQPHFLFNAHNTISMLIRTKKYDHAIEMTSKLSDLLRSTLDNKNDQFVTLAEEVELLNKYLDIEKVRFEDVLTISVNLDINTQKTRIPNLLLQPIVENAIKHGISKHLGQAYLKINSEMTGSNIRISIANSGPAIEGTVKNLAERGIGLRNVINRLERIYGDQFSFDLQNVKSGVLCQITIPNE